MDVAVRKSIWKVIGKLKQRMAVIVTTHSMEEAEALCDRIGILSKGRLGCVGSPGRLTSVYGSGFQVQVNSEKVEEMIDHFLENMGMETWHVARRIGRHVVFQRTRSGIAAYQTLIESAHNDIEKSILGYQELERVFGVLEDAANSGCFGQIQYEVRETTLGQVFLYFQNK
jgi:ABC-type multidrug transport system ATPase subunit